MLQLDIFGQETNDYGPRPKGDAQWMRSAFPFNIPRADAGLWSVYDADAVKPPIVPSDCGRCSFRFMQRVRSTTFPHPNGKTRDQVAIYRPNQYCDVSGGIAAARPGADRDTIRAAYQWLKTQPCKDCRRRLIPAAMEFDHDPKHDKVGDMSSLVDRASMAGFIDELAKCDVVCANCHRARTEGRRASGTEEG